MRLAVHSLMALVLLGACVGGGAETLRRVPAESLYVAMTEQDRALSALTLQRALNGNGAPETWRSVTGSSGTITPEREFTIAGGVRCRDYQEYLFVAAKEATALNTACQNTDGSWRTVAVTTPR